jgi:hypothetical protein
MRDGTSLFEEYKAVCSFLVSGFACVYKDVFPHKNMGVLSKKNFKLIHLFAPAVVASVAVAAAADKNNSNNSSSSSSNNNCNKRHHIDLYEARRAEAIKLYSYSFAMKFVIGYYILSYFVYC